MDFLEDNIETILIKYPKLLITETFTLEDKFKKRKKFYKKYKNDINFCKPIGIGGLISVTVQILYGECDAVVFFDDLDGGIGKISNNPNSNEDPLLDNLVKLQLITYNYQVVLSACKINQNVLVKRTKQETIDWMDKLTHPVSTSKREDIIIHFKIDEKNSEATIQKYNELSILIEKLNAKNLGYKMRLRLKGLGSIEAEITFTITISFEQFFETFFEQFYHQFTEEFMNFRTLLDATLFGWLGKNKIIARFKFRDNCLESIIEYCQKEKINISKPELIQIKKSKGIKFVENNKEITIYCDESGKVKKTDSKIDSKKIEIEQ